MTTGYPHYFFFPSSVRGTDHLFLHALNWATVPERDITVPGEREKETERGTQMEETGKQTTEYMGAPVFSDLY